MLLRSITLVADPKGALQPVPLPVGKSEKMNIQVRFDAQDFSRVTQISEIKIGRSREKHRHDCLAL